MPENVDAVKDSLRTYIVEQFLPGEDPENLADDLQLKESGVLDSMSTLSLVSHVEKTYNIEVEPHEASNEFGTVAEIADLIVRKT